jgi:hypothetical protein
MTRAKSQEVDGIRYWTIGRPPARNSPRKAIVHLLPIYDEYLVAYRDRHAVPHSIYSAWTSGLRHTLVIGGQVAGTWRTNSDGKGVVVEVEPRKRLTPGEQRALTQAARRYGRFLAASLSLSVT